MNIPSCFQYVIEQTPVDFWAGLSSKEELIKKLEKDILDDDETVFYNNGNEYDYLTRKKISLLEKKINKLNTFVEWSVFRIAHEPAHTIKFHTLIPTEDTSAAALCAVAKISNNGTTYIFTNSVTYAFYLSKNNCYRTLIYENYKAVYHLLYDNLLFKEVNGENLLKEMENL